jgi:SMI1 / KNR4 family (SUKH-1)
MGALVRRKAPATERKIAAADNALGLPIPETYRSFLAVTDGGQPIQSHFSEMVGVQEFLGLDDLIKYNSMLQGRIPAEMLPIATAEGGNLILMAASRDQEAAVYFWDHEREEADSPILKLASSFDDFVSRLSSGPSLSGPRPQVVSVKVRNPDVFRELLRSDQEMKDAPTVEWPPPR